MFRRLRAAYESLIAALTDHTASVREADVRFREFFALDAAEVPAEPPALPPASAETSIAHTTTEAAPAEAPATNGRSRKRVAVGG